MPNRTLYFDHEGHRAVRDGRYKSSALRGEAWDLYNMERDRIEMEDLAGELPSFACGKSIAIRPVAALTVAARDVEWLRPAFLKASSQALHIRLHKEGHVWFTGRRRAPKLEHPICSLLQ